MGQSDVVPKFIRCVESEYTLIAVTTCSTSGRSSGLGRSCWICSCTQIMASELKMSVTSCLGRVSGCSRVLCFQRRRWGNQWNFLAVGSQKAILMTSIKLHIQIFLMRNPGVLSSSSFSSASHAPFPNRQPTAPRAQSAAPASAPPSSHDSSPRTSSGPTPPPP